jgi:hypothetical protein
VIVLSLRSARPVATFAVLSALTHCFGADLSPLLDIKRKGMPGHAAII